MPSIGYFVAILPVSMPIDPFIRLGPLELIGEPGTSEQFTTDTASRRRYVSDPFIRIMLWGADKDDRRFHRVDDLNVAIVSDRGTSIGLHLEAYELVKVEEASQSGFAIVHGRVDIGNARADVLIELADIDPHHGSVVRAVYQDYLGPTILIDQEVRRARMLYLADLAGQPSKLDKGSSMPAVDQWLWYLSTAQLPSRISIPEGAQSRVKENRFAVSGRWDAVAMGDAVTYVTSEGNARDATAAVDFDRRLVRFRTIDVDLTLLVEIQNALCSVILRTLSANQNLGDGQVGNRTARHLLRVYRSTFWGERVLERGPGVGLVLGLRKNQNHEVRLEDLGRRMSALEQELQSALTSQTNAALALIAVLGLPLSVAMTAWSISASTNPWVGVWAVLAAAAASAIVLVIFPGLRRLIRDAYPRRERDRKQP